MRICDLNAEPPSRAIHARKVSCREVMRATLDRAGRLNPRLNAFVNLAPQDALLKLADERDAELLRIAAGYGMLVPKLLARRPAAARG